jgi:DNA-binding Lrp family transcriptional regulator
VDLDILTSQSLIEDARKSFRVISREIKVNATHSQVYFERLVNIGLIKSAKQEVDLSRVDSRKGSFSATKTSAPKQTKQEFQCKD